MRTRSARDIQNSIRFPRTGVKADNVGHHQRGGGEVYERVFVSVQRARVWTRAQTGTACRMQTTVRGW